MDPKPLPYLGRLQKAQRLVKSALFRHDAKLAVRELCESLDELTNALIDREQEQNPSSPANPSSTSP
ncbi:MAG TPA: hypothetical protein VGY66_20940 [Gemmataceae bacterium]|jgi:hypothetical protein|nr:hypothetical protein [Gemmataceae bacterium]